METVEGVTELALTISRTRVRKARSSMAAASLPVIGLYQNACLESLALHD